MVVLAALLYAAVVALLLDCAAAAWRDGRTGEAALGVGMVVLWCGIWW